MRFTRAKERGWGLRIQKGERPLAGR